MSTLKVRIEIAVNLLTGRTLFPEFSQQTVEVGRCLGILSVTRCSKRSVLRAGDVLERSHSPYIGLGAFIAVLTNEVGTEQVTHPKHHDRVTEWLKSLTEQGHFPEEAEFPCFFGNSLKKVEVPA